MTPESLLLGAVSNAAHSRPMLAGVLIGHGFPIDAAYREVDQIMARLVARNLVSYHEHSQSWQTLGRMEPKEFSIFKADEAFSDEVSAQLAAKQREINERHPPRKITKRAKPITASQVAPNVPKQFAHLTVYNPKKSE